MQNKIERQIVDQLRKDFNPSELQLNNESHLHRGHAGWNGSGETHFKLVLQSKRFNGLNRIERHRLVYKSLSPQPMEQIHALKMELLGD